MFINYKQGTTLSKNAHFLYSHEYKHTHSGIIGPLEHINLIIYRYYYNHLTLNSQVP